MKAMPKVSKYMTTLPHTTNSKLPLQEAYNLMISESIRHLPVLNGGTLVGMLSDRDVKFAASFGDLSKMLVEDVMTPDVYSVHPDTELDNVVESMAQSKFGCAVIQQENNKVVGVFTASDSLRVLATVLRSHYRDLQ
jgi:acetoin utilization protein AcuB